MCSTTPFIVLLVLTLIAHAYCSETPDIPQIIQSMYQKTQSLQSLHDVSYRAFPPRFEERAGIYRTDVKLNFNGDWEMDILRHLFAIEDINLFVSNFVQIALLETESLGMIELDSKRLQLTIDAILSFRDKNFDQGVPLYNFWPQKLVNQTWTAYPVNLIKPLEYFPTFADYVKTILKFLHLDHLWDRIASSIEELENMVASFKIPSDTDDSSCNLALGALLYKNREKYPQAFKNWAEINQKYDDAFDVLLRYAYRPLDTNQTTHGVFSIDPRSYYVAHEFIEQKKHAGESLLLPSTWLLDLTDDRRSYPLVTMPFHVNNIDASVITNFIYGVSMHAIHVDSTIFDRHSNLKQMYLDSISFIQWAFDSDQIVKRPDLLLTYYPSIFDFYWFVSRTIFAVDSSIEKFSFSEQLKPIMNRLTQTMRTKGVENILKTAHEENDWIYWDDFLGDGGKKPHGEDRLFSTSLALNFLMDTFTQEDKTCRRKFIDTIPSDLKQKIKRVVNYISENYNTRNAYYSNAFFSGSVKGLSTIPFFFPGNDFRYLNGTVITQFPPKDPELINKELIDQVIGTIEPSKYDEYLKMKWFGVNVPTHQSDFNDGAFPFWSSDALTSSMIMLSLSKYHVAMSCQ